MSEYRFLNPYNFVRCLDVPENREGKEAPKTKILGRCAPPPHDRFLGLTGRISCELEAKTPIFISDSESVEGTEHKSYRFFRLENECGEEEYAIPSTSLRGMFRSVFEAVTNSCFGVFEGEKRLTYRLNPGTAKSLVPARLERSKTGDWQLRLLPGTTRFRIEGPLPDDCLYSAWVKRYRPTKKSETERQNLSSPYSNRRIVELPFRHSDKCFALLEKMEHPARKTRRGIIKEFYFWNVKEVAGSKEGLPKPEKDQRIEEGFLFITNKNIENKHDERFFFRSKDNNSLPERIHLPNDILEKYKSLIEDYKGRHVKKVDKIRRQSEDPSKATDERMTYSRFIVDDKRNDYLEGELVYVKLVGESGNLSVQYIVPVTVSRLQYEYTIGELLRKSKTDPSNPCNKYSNLCPACRVFGWVNQSPPKETTRESYAGRIKISHAIIVENKGNLQELPLAILSAPKPTTTFFYLFKNGTPDFNIDYNSSNARLRGRKFYRHQEKAREQEYKRAEKDDQNRTLRDAIAPEAKFIFTIEFENLAPIELGALLWSIEMESGMFHKLGMGKPLGLGSVKVRINTIEIIDPKKRYFSFEANGWKKVDVEKQAKWVEQFKVAMKDRYGKDFNDLENIKDLKAILSATDLPVHYPRTSEQPNPEGKNYEWFMGNKRYGRKPLKLASEDAEGFPVKFGP